MNREQEEKNFKIKFDEIIKNSENVLVTTHMGPDSDALGSLIGLNYYLEKEFPNKNIRLIISATKPSDSFSYLPNFEKIEWVEDISMIVNEFDTVVFLDGNYIDRFTNNPDLIINSNSKKICIDHHVSNNVEFDLQLIDSDRVATSEIIYVEFFQNLEVLVKDLGVNLMNGIMGDTGFFRFIRYDNANAFKAIEEIITKASLDLEEIYRDQTQISESGFVGFKYLVCNSKFTLINSNKLMYTFLSKKELGSFKDRKSVLEMYKMQVLRQIRGYDFGFIVNPSSDDTDRSFELSFRSTVGAPNVKLICMEHFNGNGHVFAAGGKLVFEEDKEIEEVVEYILNKLEETEFEIIKLKE